VGSGAPPVLVDDRVAGHPRHPVRQPFLIIDRAQVLVDPQQDVCDQVLGSVRVGDPAAHEPRSCAMTSRHIGSLTGCAMAGLAASISSGTSLVTCFEYSGRCSIVIDDGSAARTQPAQRSAGRIPLPPSPHRQRQPVMKRVGAFRCRLLAEAR
jgi:hypothetical protein